MRERSSQAKLRGFIKCAGAWEVKVKATTRLCQAKQQWLVKSKLYAWKM